ncbi:MAG: type II toxin-antitoxin system RelE/ParE family toxin [Candidatus Zixiibacteriota bacterium]
MKYKVIVHKRAARYLKSLPESQRQRIKQSLRELEGGITGKVDVKSMAGEWKGYYRMRIGDDRVIFWIDHKLKTMYVDHIGSRGEIYKKK